MFLNWSPRLTFAFTGLLVTHFELTIDHSQGNFDFLKIHAVSTSPEKAVGVELLNPKTELERRGRRRGFNSSKT